MESETEIKVEVKGVGTIPEQYGYDTSYSALWIDPKERICGVEQKERRGAVPCDEFHNIIITRDVDDNNARVRSKELKEYLNSPSAQILLDRICNGWYTDYDGRNWVGILDDDASSAIDELQSEIQERASFRDYEPTLMRADEWVGESESDVTALTTDDELCDLAESYESEANDEGIYITNSVYNLLERWRDEYLDEWLERAKDAVLDAWEIDEEMVVTYQRLDNSTLEVKLEWGDGIFTIVHVTEDETAVVTAPVV